MTLIRLDQVMKQEGSRTILKDIDLVVREKSQIGIKMSVEESEMLFRLITGSVVPSSGLITKETDSILVEYKDDGLYDSLTVQRYLSFFKKIADFQSSLEEYISAFSLLDVWQTKINGLTKDQQKRVSLFRMFLFSPRVVLIENPLDHLTDEGIELYLKSLEILRAKDIATLCTSTHTEDLLLLSHEVYRYHATNGLEQTDLIQKTDLTDEGEEESEPIRPRNVFKVTCKMADKTIFFSPDEIDFIESINSVSHVRIGEESFPTEFTMNDLEEKLRTFGFFRCHRSYLVNLQRISELISYSKNSYTLILKGRSNVKLPLSRSRLDEMKQLIEF